MKYLSQPMTAEQARAHQVGMAAAYQNQLRPLDPDCPTNGLVADLESACLAYLEAYLGAMTSREKAAPSPAPVVHAVFKMAADKCREVAAYMRRTDGYYNTDDAARSFEVTAGDIESLGYGFASKPLRDAYGENEVSRCFEVATQLCNAKAQALRNSHHSSFSRERTAKAYDEVAAAIESLSFDVIKHELAMKQLTDHEVV